MIDDAELIKTLVRVSLAVSFFFNYRLDSLPVATDRVKTQLDGVIDHLDGGK